MTSYLDRVVQLPILLLEPPKKDAAFRDTIKANHIYIVFIYNCTLNMTYGMFIAHTIYIYLMSVHFQSQACDSSS